MLRNSVCYILVYVYCNQQSLCCCTLNESIKLETMGDCFHAQTIRFKVDQFVILADLFCQIWDVLSNKEVVDIVAAAPSRSTAARYLVETAVRAWRLKYPTSKIDDCAVVCLFLDSNLNSSSTFVTKSDEQTGTMGGVTLHSEKHDKVPQSPSDSHLSGSVRDPEILPESEEEASNKRASGIEDEWSALDGVSRVNTMLTLPRFVTGKQEIRPTGETKPRK